MNRKEIAEKISNSLVVIPVGAIEQHGPHLPMNTDTVIVDEIAKKACEEAPSNFSLFRVPTISYGNSHHHFPFPAVSLTSETLLAVLKDLIGSIVLCGCKNIFILNSHGGNDEAIRIVARDMSRECKIPIAAASYWTIAWDRLVNECNALSMGRVPGHAGSFETSIMLALTQDVKLNKRIPPRSDHIPKADNARRIYISRPHNTVGINGVSDDARYASKTFGQRALKVIDEELVKTFKNFMRKNNNLLGGS